MIRFGGMMGMMGNGGAESFPHKPVVFIYVFSFFGNGGMGIKELENKELGGTPSYAVPARRALPAANLGLSFPLPKTTKNGGLLPISFGNEGHSQLPRRASGPAGVPIRRV